MKIQYLPYRPRYPAVRGQTWIAREATEVVPKPNMCALTEDPRDCNSGLWREDVQLARAGYEWFLVTHLDLFSRACDLGNRAVWPSKDSFEHRLRILRKNQRKETSEARERTGTYEEQASAGMKFTASISETKRNYPSTSLFHPSEREKKKP